MAFFGVTIEKIELITDHPNADRLSIAKLAGLSFQFVIGKNLFNIGDTVLYFPIDSLLPKDLIEKLGMVGKFSGKDKNRIKTIKLRGLISQGYVTNPEKVLPLEFMNKTSEEITSFLGVEKYEPPTNMTNSGNLIELPYGFSKYDIESADRFQNIIDLLMDQEVVIMEKMEGTNLSIVKSESEKVCVNQRSNSIIEIEGHINSYWEAARTEKLIEVVDKMPKISGLYGELCGSAIQKNIYKLKNHKVFVFDIKFEGKWLGWKDFDFFVKRHNLLIAPILFVGKLKDFMNGKSIQELSNGKSVINPNTLREGIVIKPIIEQFHPQLGRLIIKQRSPEYLSEED